MGTYVNNGIVSFLSLTDIDDMMEELVTLLGIGTRKEGEYQGRYVFADIYQSDLVNMWSKKGPFSSSVEIFDSEDARELARKHVCYNIYGDIKTLTNNTRVKLVSWYRYGLWGVPNRIRDFHGYNHYAKGGVQFKDIADGKSPDTDKEMSLSIYPDMGDNITLRDVMENDLAHYGLDKFALMLIDPFGFWHDAVRLGGDTEITVRTLDGMIQYLESSTDKVKVDGAFPDSHISYRSVPAPTSTESVNWYLGVMGWNDKNTRYLINAVKFPAVPIKVAPIQVTGWTPEMYVGTAYEGRSRLGDHIYGDAGPINCCQDDFLFLRFLFVNMQQNVLLGPSLRVVIITNVNAVPKSTPLLVYNKEGNYQMQPGVTLGGGGTLTNWANGSPYIRTTSLWAEAGGDFAGFIAIASVVNNQTTLLTPYVRLGLHNTGVSVNNVTPPSLTLPDVRPVYGWETLR